MTGKQLRPIQILIFAIALALLIVSDLRVAKAHQFVKFLSPPYYGAGNPTPGRRWVQGSHYGIDFLLRSERWDRVVAAANGVVEVSEWYDVNCHDETQCPGTVSGFGLHVRIRHDGFGNEVNYTHYGHLSVARPTGQVSAGEWIGTSGDSGNSCGDPCGGVPHAPHLHFEVTHRCATDTSGCSVDPDNADGAGTSLWLTGEWTGNNPARSKAKKRYITLGTYSSEIIIDDNTNNTGGFTRGRNVTHVCTSDADCPHWHPVTGAGYSNDYQWTFDNNSSTDYWAEWRPNLPSSADYEILAWMPCGSGNQDNPDFTAWSAYYYMGNFGPIKVDQLTLGRYDATSYRRGCNRWIGFGIYNLPAGTASYVRIEDRTDESGIIRSTKIGVDAVKFVRVNVGGFEAEDFRKKVARNDQGGVSHYWEKYAPGLYGGNYISARPNTGANINTNIESYSPDTKYNVIFPTAGIYYVWIRGYGTHESEDSIHAGTENLVEITADKISCPQWYQAIWYWCNNTTQGIVATLNIPTPGFRTFNLWMREDGFNADEVILSKDPNYNAQTTPTIKVPYIFPGDDTEPDP